jgi:hypothetical protein
MKKIIFSVIMLFSISSIGQVTETVKESPEENSIESLLVGYVKEATEVSKDLVSSTLSIAEKAIEILIEQGSIIVTQYIIYTSISYGLKILLGIVLILWLPRRIYKELSIDSSIAEKHNKDIDESIETYKEPKKVKVFNKYYNNTLNAVISNLVVLGGYVLGYSLVLFNIMTFIKVLFFPKLYLVELLTKYI